MFVALVEFVALVAFVDVVALPNKDPTKVVAVNVDVKGSYVSVGVILSIYNPVFPLLYTNGIYPWPVAFVDVTFMFVALVEFVEFVDDVEVVALPNKDPTKVVADNVDDDGSYISVGVILSMYSPVYPVFDTNGK